MSVDLPLDFQLLEWYEFEMVSKLVLNAGKLEENIKKDTKKQLHCRLYSVEHQMWCLLDAKMMYIVCNCFEMKILSEF